MPPDSETWIRRHIRRINVDALDATFVFIQILGEGTVVPGAVGAFLSLYQPVRIFILQAGAFFVLAVLIAIMNKVKADMEAKGKDTSHFKAGGCCQAPNAKKTFEKIEKKEAEKAVESKESEVEE